MNTLTEILEKYQESFKALTVTILKQYHEQYYHIDDIQFPDQFDRVIKLGNKLFLLEINLTKNIFSLKRLLAGEINGVVTTSDKEKIIEILSGIIYK